MVHVDSESHMSGPFTNEGGNGGFTFRATAIAAPSSGAFPAKAAEHLNDLTLFKNSMTSMTSSYNTMLKASQRIEAKLRDDTDALEASRAKFAETKVAIEGELDKFKGRVKLNVGGVKYETTLTTLTADGDDSMLGSMFSGRHELHPDDDGEVFIDRDGKHFGHILNVLRDSSVAVNINDRAALHAELKYHGISEERCKRLIIVSDHNGNRCRFDVFGKAL